MIEGGKSNYIITTAKENLETFTEKQQLFWNCFYDGKTDIGPIDRSMIDPLKMKSLLPSIWMGDLIFDDDQKLVNVFVRLLGTNIANLYGELTNSNLMSDDGENSYQRNFAGSYQRFLKSLDLLLETKQPVIVNADFVSNRKKYISSKGLLIPVCNNSSKINMVIELLIFA
ncbi:MAG: hypothetical protein JKY84_01525 [Emcibacteraceae bacterium]|nr:hypothetical protein [Emcibacteraceae bacterium]